ncbi:MAG: aminotransferase class V-fold PLP-dependent enzyme [Micromonosporaceae bacterium]|nr:aminotransferase class V-fold PLP-dependent enzyme [Micromonosporaceae bacterium]
MAFFDAAAGAPLHPVAAQALRAAQQDGWADPARLYAQARRARQLLDAARESVAESLSVAASQPVRADQVRFLPSGTAAAHAAVAGARLAQERTGASVVHSAIEHSAVLYAAATGPTVPVGVDRLGRLDEEAFAAAVRAPGVALAALISASHEVGTAQPVAEAAQAAASAGVPLYVDAAASLGHRTVPGGWSLLSGSARKWGGPAGVGLLVVGRGAPREDSRSQERTPWLPPWPGAEPGLLDPPGGLNLPAVVAAAAALRAVLAERETTAARLATLTERIRAGVAAGVPDVQVLGDPVRRLPHLVAFSCLYVDGEALQHELDRAGFAVSSGSSCTASTLRPSHVLEAMGVLSHGNVRVSLPRDTTDAEVDEFLALLPGIVAGLRAQAGAVGL